MRDGSTVLIRQVQASDAPLLADGFARLSAESRATRCLGAKKELSPAELRYLTDVDHHDHEALGALEHPGGQGVGIARYIRHPSDPQAAEIAVTVVDGWQGRGLGTELINQLSCHAWREGIRRFTAMATADNLAAIRLLRAMRAQPGLREAGAVEYEITLEDHALAGTWMVTCAWLIGGAGLLAPARGRIQPPRGDMPVFPQVPAAAIGSEAQQQAPGRVISPSSGSTIAVHHSTATLASVAIGRPIRATISCCDPAPRRQ